MTHRLTLCILLSVALTLATIGCSSNTGQPDGNLPADPSAADQGDGDSADDGTGAGETAATKAEAEPLLQPFDAPALADLDAKAKWEDQPVVDAMKLLEEHLAGQQPLVPVEEALTLENDSNEANAKILSALGQPPASQGEVDWDARLNRRIKGDINSPNAILHSSAIDMEVGMLTSLFLFGFDWEFKPFAAAEAVKSWQTSHDRMYDKLVLRDDLTWSDGKPVTAHDVAFTFQAIMNPLVPAVAVRSGTDKIRWVEAYDDHTLVYFHKESLSTNVWNVNFPIIPKHIYGESIKEDPKLTTSKHHIEQEYSPVTGGPYEYVRRKRDEEILLKRRESWHMHDGKEVRRKPYFKEVRMSVIKDANTALLALKGGDIDEAEMTAAQWKTQSSDNDFYQRNTKGMATEWVYFYFGWNNDPKRAPFFTDKRVRQAMSYAFDHKEMLEKLNYGLYEPCNGIYHSTAWMAPKNPPKPYTQNLDKAEDLLDAAGWGDSDGDGIRDKTIAGRNVKFEFSIMTSESEEAVNICKLLKGNLEQIGILCNVRPTEWTSMQERARTHDFQAMYAGWGTGTDPDMSENLWGIDQDRNYVQYANPKIDKLYEQGRKEFDREKRAEIYAQIHQTLYEDQPYTWLYFRNAFYGFNKDLRGYMFSPRGPYSYNPGILSIYATAE